MSFYGCIKEITLSHVINYISDPKDEPPVERWGISGGDEEKAEDVLLGNSPKWKKEDKRTFACVRVQGFQGFRGLDALAV